MGTRARRAAITANPVGKLDVIGRHRRFRTLLTVGVSEVSDQVTVTVYSVSTVRLGHLGIAIHLRVTAVSKATGPTVAVLVEVLIRNAVAVIVPTVTVVLSHWAHSRVTVVTVTRTRTPTIGVAVHKVIHAITICIQCTGALGERTRMTSLVRIVAVTGTDRNTVPVLISRIVRQSVTVIVEPIAELLCPRKDVALRIVAIPITGAYPVSIEVLVFIHFPVAVVVQAVATIFEAAWVNEGSGIITVGGSTGLTTSEPTIAIKVDLVRRQHTVAVVVESITELKGPRHRRGVPWVTVITVAHTVTVDILRRDQPVTVPVLGVLAGLLHSRTAVRVIVITVPLTDLNSIPVEVGLTVITIAVVIFAIAEFNGERRAARVTIITIACAGRGTVTIGITAENQPEAAAGIRQTITAIVAPKDQEV